MSRFFSECMNLKLIRTRFYLDIYWVLNLILKDLQEMVLSKLAPDGIGPY